MPIYKTKNEDFFKKWSSETAYVLGFFAADGNMLRNNRGAHFMELTSTDKDIIVKIKNILGSSHKISCRKRDKKWKPAYRLQIGSKEIFNDLIKLGMMPAKSNIIKLPNIPNSYFNDFLRGYFDGDGCVHFGRYIRKDRGTWKWEFTTRFTSGSKIFLEELLSRLKQDLSGGFIYKKNRGYDLVFSRNDSIVLHRLMYYNISSNLLLKRKFDIFKKAFKILNLGT